MLPEIAQFFTRYPDLELEIRRDDRRVDRVREGVDGVLRAVWQRCSKRPVPAEGHWVEGLAPWQPAPPPAVTPRAGVGGWAGRCEGERSVRGWLVQVL